MDDELAVSPACDPTLLRRWTLPWGLPAGLAIDARSATGAKLPVRFGGVIPASQGVSLGPQIAEVISIFRVIEAGSDDGGFAIATG